MDDAQAWLHTLVQAHRDALLGCDYDVSRDDIEEATRALCYSIAVRSGWTGPGAPMMPDEFRLLVGGNGPTVEVVGELDGMFEPEAVDLLVNDLRVPSLTEEQQDALDWFAGLFTYHI
jgi:hypothetical protein